MLDALVALKPPVKPPVTVGTDQLYNVLDGTMPLIIFDGDNTNAIPLQVTDVRLLILAFGETVTVTVNTAPMQEPDKGVTI